VELVNAGGPWPDHGVHQSQVGTNMPSTDGTSTPRSRAKRPSISAVVPMYDEAAAAPAFLLELRDGLRALTDRFEIVVVNDGSRDGTRDAVLAAPPDCCVHYLELSRNFGKEAALSAGLEAARGEVVVLLDGDGQHPVELIATMLQRWREGWDVAYGLRKGRREESLRKRVGAGTFYKLLAWSSRVEIPAGAGDFRLMDRRVVEALKQLPERDRFMKGLYAWVGFRSVGVPFDPRPRLAGTSSFGTVALTRLALSGLTAFTTLPLRLVSGLGVLVSTAAVLYGAWVVIDKLVYGVDQPGYPTIVASLMFSAGVQLLSIGIIGEYLGRVFNEAKGRPVYVVAEDVDRSPLGVAPAASRPEGTSTGAAI
jgi:glycosyltransferase involved in cell wall biosynthesis